MGDAERSLTLRLRVSSSEFDAAMAGAGTKVRILRGELETTGTSASKSAKAFDVWGDSVNKAGNSAKTAHGHVSLLGPAIVSLAPALIPIGAAAAAAAGSFGMMGAAGLLAVKGIQAEMKASSTIGLQYSGLLGILKMNLAELEKTAAKNFLAPFATAVHQAQGYMPGLNTEIGKFATIGGKIGGNVLSGMLGGLRDLEPLLLQLGVGAEGLSAKFAAWMNNGGMQKFVAYTQSVLPEVSQTLTSVAQAILAISGAAAPMGMVSTQAMHMVADAINAIPVGVLHTLVPLLAAGYLGFKAWMALGPVIATVRGMTAALAAYEAVQLQSAGVTAAAAAANSSAAGGLRLLAAAYGGLVVGAAVAGAIVIANNKLSASLSAVPAKAGDASNALLKLGQNGEITSKLLTSFGDSAGNFGSVMENAFKESNWTRLKDFQVFGLGTPFNSATKDAKNFFKSTDAGLSQLMTVGNKVGAQNAFKVLADGAAKQGISVDQLLSKLPQYKAQLDAIKAAQIPLTAAQLAQAQALQTVAAQFGTTASAYQTAISANKSAADQLAATTLQMKLQNDAAGLLTQALDKLNGGNQSYADALNSYQQNLVNMAKHVSGADAALEGMSSSAIKNRGDLNNLAKGVKDTAAAYGAMTDAQGNHIHNTEQARQELIKMKADLVNQAVAWGENRAQVQSYIDGLIHIPPKATTTGVLETTGADDALNAYKAKIAQLPSSIQTQVYLAGLTTAEYQLQLLARNRTATVTVTVGGAGATGVRSVGGVQAFDKNVPGRASGGSLPEGFSTINERGWELLYKQGNNVQVIPHDQAKQLLPHGPSVPAYASGTGGIVSITPSKSKSKKKSSSSSKGSKGSPTAQQAAGISVTALGYEYAGIFYSTMVAAVNAKTRAEQAAMRKAAADATKTITIEYNGGSFVEALVTGIASKKDLGAAAMAKLSKAMEIGFDLRWLTQKFNALKEEAASFQSSVKSALTGRTNVTQVGVGENNPTGYIPNAGAIQAGFNTQTRQNNEFGSLIKILGDRGVSKAYLKALENEGIDALPVLRVLANSSKAQGVAVGKSYDASIASAGRAANVATNQQFGPQLAAFAKESAKLYAQMSAFVSSASALSSRPIVLQIDGKTVLRATQTAAAKKARR